jgi:hypothetical protein
VPRRATSIGHTRSVDLGCAQGQGDEEAAASDIASLDLAPHTSQDRDAEIARLERLGARRVDVGQSADVMWTVLADREGNEFCVLSTRDR